MPDARCSSLEVDRLLAFGAAAALVLDRFAKSSAAGALEAVSAGAGALALPSELAIASEVELESIIAAFSSTFIPMRLSGFFELHAPKSSSATATGPTFAKDICRCAGGRNGTNSALILMARTPLLEEFEHHFARGRRRSTNAGIPLATFASIAAEPNRRSERFARAACACRRAASGCQCL